MFTISSLLILFILTFKFLSSYIKTIRTGDPNETNLTYWMFSYCLLYTSDAADDTPCVDLGGRRIIK